MVAVRKFEDGEYENGVNETVILDEEEAQQIFQLAYEMCGGRLSGEFWIRVIVNVLTDPQFTSDKILFHNNWHIRPGNGLVGISADNGQELTQATIDYIVQSSELQEIGGVDWVRKGQEVFFCQRRRH